MKKNYKSIFILFGIIIMLVLSLINSNLLIYNIISYTKLFITKLFPTSFIFFIMSSLLIDYCFASLISNIFHINGGVFYVVLMSILSGFPSGAKYIRDLYDKKIISLDTSNYLITFTHFPNPLFILGSVNLVIKDNLLCQLILISLISSNLLIGLITKKKEKNYYNIQNSSSYSFTYYLSNAINSSFKTIILIYGTSLFFNLISVYIIRYIHINYYFNIILSGLFDLTKGVFSTQIISNNIFKSLIIIVFVSFGGISIHMQVKSIIDNTLISYKSFFLGRMFQIIISCMIFLIFLIFFNYI